LLILKTHPDKLTEKDQIIHIPFFTLNQVYKDTDELMTDLVDSVHGQSQLISKIKKKFRGSWSVGANIGFFAINYTADR